MRYLCIHFPTYCRSSRSLCPYDFHLSYDSTYKNGETSDSYSEVVEADAMAGALDGYIVEFNIL